MPFRRCPYCKKRFEPSRYRPDQAVCSIEDCQRKRRAAYHRQKLADDPVYRVQCRESKKKWRDAHPAYMSRYRAFGGPESSQHPAEVLKRLIKSVENNLALRIRDCAADVWLLGRDDSVKNILASAYLIVVEVNSTTNETAGEREHLIGRSARNDV
jgi:hypothetical protein